MYGRRDGRRLRPNGPRARGYEATSVKGGPVPPPFPRRRPPVSSPGPSPFLPSPGGASLGAPLPPSPRFLSGVTLPRGATGRFAVARGGTPTRSPPQPPVPGGLSPGSPMCSRREVCFRNRGTTSLRFLPSFRRSFIHPSSRFLLH